MKDGILFVGPVGKGGGPSIKNDILIRYLGRKNVKVWNTFDRSIKVRLGAIAQILFNPRQHIIVGVSHRGRNLLYPVLWIRQKLTGAHTACIVIGGNAVERFNNHLCVKAMKGADFVTVETEGLLKEMQEAYGLSNLYLLPNYKQLSEISLPQLPENHFRETIHFVFLSGMRNAKGVKTLLRAYQQVVAEGYDAKLCYYGPVIEGDLDPDILEEMKNIDGVDYCGAVDNAQVLETLSKHQVFVFPSEYEGEGFPAVLVEAMAAGLPVISSDINYNPELIHQGENGLLFPSGDVSALASCMKQCIENRDFLEQVSETNRKRAMDFDASTLCRRFGQQLKRKGWPLRTKENGKRPRVAIVLPYFYHGGAENMVSRLVSHLNLKKIEAEVFCIYGKPMGNHLEKAVKDHKVPIHYIGKGKGFSPKAMIRLWNELAAFKPDVIHTHLSACVYCAGYVLTHRVKMLHTVHNMPQYELIKPKRLVMHIMYALRKAIPVALSEENRKLIEEFYHVEKPVHLIYNPVNLEEYDLPMRKSSKKEIQDQQPFIFLTAGRISVQKNHKLMLDAFAKTKRMIQEQNTTKYNKCDIQRENDAETEQSERQIHLQILGDGPLLEELKSSNLDSDVTFTGNVDNVADYMADADAFLLSSLYEGLPLVVLEAMASGLPIISTRVGGVCDVVTDNGILTDIDSDELAEAMVKIYRDHTLRDKMGMAALENVKRFDSSAIAEEYSNLYLALSARVKR